jgi:hypothetical protein
MGFDEVARGYHNADALAAASTSASEESPAKYRQTVQVIDPESR